MAATNQKNDIATQQKTLRTKAAERSSTAAGTSKLGLDHFEKYDVVSKTSFALLGGMAGELLNRNGRKLTGVLHGLENKEYCEVAKELFEELCAAIDLPPSVIGQCINACDKLVLDSRPKKIKTKKIDASAMDKLEEDNMGEEDADDKKKAGAPGSKRGPKGPLVDSDDDGDAVAGEDGAVVEEYNDEQLEKMKKAEEEKRAAEEKEAAAQRKAREEAERRIRMMEENEARMKAQARQVDTSAFELEGMTVMKKNDDDDDLMAFANLGKGKKGGGKKR